MKKTCFSRSREREEFSHLDTEEASLSDPVGSFCISFILVTNNYGCCQFQIHKESCSGAMLTEAAHLDFTVSPEIFFLLKHKIRD